MYQNRRDAGKKLAEVLAHYRNRPEVIIIGLPRGGVAVAHEIAQTLNCPLDILIVRKIGFPGNPELAAGAVSETGTVVINENIVSDYRVSATYLDSEINRQKEELARRVTLFRGGKGISPLAGRTVILVDDGVATGATVKAAISTLKQENIAKLVVAMPVASQEAQSELSKLADEWICLQAPAGFMSVGSYYYDLHRKRYEVMAMLQ